MVTAAWSNSSTKRLTSRRLIEPDEVIVKLKAAAINHIDIWNRMGATGIVVAMPHILGADGAGVVADVGAKVENVKVGDSVCLYPPTGCGHCEFCLTDRDFMCFRLRVLGERLEGTYAQYVKLPAQNCFPIPQGYSFEEAAAFPLVFITLWRMLITNAGWSRAKPFLLSASAAAWRAHRCSWQKNRRARDRHFRQRCEARTRAEFWRRPRHQSSENVIVAAVQSLTGNRGVDVVLDSVGGEVWRKSLASLARGGRLVTCGATAGGQPIDDIAAICSKELKIYGSTLGSREEFHQVINFLNAAKIKPIIDRFFPSRKARRRNAMSKMLSNLVRLC